MAFQIKILSPLAFPLQLAVDTSLSSGQWDMDRSNICDLQVMYLKAECGLLFLFPTGWNARVMVGAGVAILDCEWKAV